MKFNEKYQKENYLCHNTGRLFFPAFSYCPHCGEKISIQEMTFGRAE
jgi:uncharacterized OB-fold protein